MSRDAARDAHHAAKRGSALGDVLLAIAIGLVLWAALSHGLKVLP
jgi:hypothetical protein